MLSDDYKKEMEHMGPSGAELDRLMDVLTEEQSGGRSPVRGGLKRRGAVLLAACALLAVTALAAGPTLWQMLQNGLGPFVPYVSQVEACAVEDQGLRMTLEGSLSDGLLTKFYVAVTDLAGDRLDERTKTDIRTDGTWLSNVAVMGTKQFPDGYDAENKTALYEVMCFGMDFTQPITISASSFQPQYYDFEQSVTDLSGLTDQALPSKAGPEGQVILAEQTGAQTFPDLPGLSITAGVASDGLFHVRFWEEEGYQDQHVLLAMPMSRATGEHYQSAEDVYTELPDGVDVAFPALTAALVSDVESIVLYGSYHGPAPAIEGTWNLEDVQLEQVETKVIEDCGTYGVFVIDSIQISPLGVSVAYRNTPGEKGVFTYQHECTIHLADGTDIKPGGPGGFMSIGGNYATWSFESPVELDQISSLSFYGQTFTF